MILCRADYRSLGFRAHPGQRARSHHAAAGVQQEETASLSARRLGVQGGMWDGLSPRLFVRCYPSAYLITGILDITGSLATTVSRA